MDGYEMWVDTSYADAFRLFYAGRSLLKFIGFVSGNSSNLVNDPAFLSLTG